MGKTCQIFNLGRVQYIKTVMLKKPPKKLQKIRALKDGSHVLREKDYTENNENPPAEMLTTGGCNQHTWYCEGRKLNWTLAPVSKILFTNMISLPRLTNIRVQTQFVQLCMIRGVYRVDSGFLKILPPPPGKFFCKRLGVSILNGFLMKGIRLYRMILVFFGDFPYFL